MRRSERPTMPGFRSSLRIAESTASPRNDTLNASPTRVKKTSGATSAISAACGTGSTKGFAFDGAVRPRSAACSALCP